MTEKLIVVTGFGPFVGHESVNASWEAVKLLPSDLNYNGQTYKIEKVLVPVEYDTVDKHVDEIWKKSPELVIHCGVHGSAKCIHLEKMAHNNSFSRPDYTGKQLDDPKICLANRGSCEKIATDLDIEKIMENLCPCDASSDSRLFQCSENVGNYLCGYIYLKSLDMNSKRCLFIHVPPVSKPLTSAETSKAIYNIIGECVKQI